MSVDISTNNNEDIPSDQSCSKAAWSSFKDFIGRLVTRKTREDIEFQIQTSRGLRELSVNWFLLIGIGIGGIIGMGIFSLSGQAAARYAGPSIIISFILCGIVALLAAISLSEIAAIMDNCGSAYTYTYAALGEYAAWFIGWNFALLYQLAAWTVVVNWSKYVVLFIENVSSYTVVKKVVQAPSVWHDDPIGVSGTGQIMNIPAIAITIGITIVLLIGIRATAIVNIVLVIFKITVLLIFIVASCPYVDTKNYSPFFPAINGTFSETPGAGMLQACPFIFFAYVGFESVVTVAQEARSRVRSLPVATISSLVISTLIYITICTIMVGLVPYSLLDTVNPLSEAVKVIPYGSWLTIIMNLGGIASMTTVALTMLLSQTRIFYAMALDGLLPPCFAKIHRHTKTPWLSTLISGAVCAIVSGIAPVDIVGDTTSLVALITYLFVHIDVIVIRYRNKDLYPSSSVLYASLIVPILGSILCILLMAGVTKGTGARFGVWVFLGQILYFSYGFWHSKKREPKSNQSVAATSELATSGESYMMESYSQNGSEKHLSSTTDETWL